MKLKPVNVLFNALAIITALAVGFVVFNLISGAKGYAVVTDSMSPALRRGDAVFVRQVDFSSLKENDVVTAEFPSGGYFTHRIISIDYDAGVFETKGDANGQPDPQPTASEQLVGKVWYSVPLLGYISIFVGSLNAIKISVIVAAAAIVVILLATVMQKNTKSKRKDDGNEQS